jgi:FAD/FMN-containing dehydrogenase
MPLDPSEWIGLRSGISGSLYLFGEAGYTYVNGYNSRAGLTKNPEAIAFPANEKDISTIVKFAYDNGITFAIRSGGHSYVGASNTDGLLLNLRGYTGVAVHDNGTRVTVKSGTKMGDVYYTLYYSGYTLGLPTASGGNEYVGVVGLALGGGHAFRTGQQGLLCQRIRAARVVLYDGSVIECDNYKNSDLLWALKGGGGGAFGVVSELTFEPHFFNRVYTVTARFTTDNIHSAFSSWQNFIVNNGNTASVSGVFIWPTEARAKSYGEGGTGFDFRLTLGISGTTTELVNYLETCGILPPGVTYTRSISSTITSVPTAPPFIENTKASFFNFGTIAGSTFSTQTIDALLQKTREYCLGICGGGTYSGLSGSYLQPGNIIFQSYRGAVNDDKTNSTSFPYKDGLHSCQFQLASWPNDGRESTFIQFMQDFFWDIASRTGYKGYCNYPMTGIGPTGPTGYGKIYWGDNLLPLQQVKKAYDPYNFFNAPHSVPPLN